MRPFPAAITVLAVALCTVTSSAAGAAGPRPALVDRGPFGGPVVSAAQDPGAPATLLVSAGNGVYRTSDAARHWTRTALPGPAVVAFAPSEAARAYAMPWQPLTYVAGSVWRSQDAGATWIKGGQPTGGPVSSLVVSPHDEQVVYAVFNASSPPEVSVNAGDSWRRLGSVGLPVDDDGNVASLFSLAVDPLDASRLLGVVSWSGAWAGGSSTVYESLDGGATWHQMPGAPSPAGVVAFDRNDPNIVTAQTPAGIAWSTDRGATWTTRPMPDTHLPVSWSPLSYLARPGAASVAAIDGAVYRTRDFGATWARVGDGPPTMLSPGEADVRALLTTPSQPGRVYEAYNDGMAVSIDGGATWSPANQGISGTTVLGLAIDPSSSSVAYASTYNGVFRSASNGWRWSLVSQLPERAAVTVDPSRPGLLYALSFHGVLRSLDDGETWQASTTGPGYQLGGRIIATRAGVEYLAVGFPDNTGMSRLVGIYVSHDHGANWQEVSTLPTNTVLPWLATEPGNPGTLLLTVSAGVLRSVDGGESWSLVQPFIGDFGAPGFVAFDPSAAGVVYAVGPHAVYRSADGGVRWTLVSSFTGFPAGFAVSDNGSLYLITGDETPAENERTSSLLASNDGGRTWATLSPAPPDVPLAALAVSPGTPGRVYVGTVGSGIASFAGLSRPRPWVALDRPRLDVGRQVGRDGAVPVTVTWHGGIAGGRVCGYRMERLRDGAWSAPRSLTARTSARTVLTTSGTATRIRVQAISCLGRDSRWSVTPRIRVAVRDDGDGRLRYAGSWSRVTSPRDLDGAHLASDDPNASLTTQLTAAEIGYVAVTSPSATPVDLILNHRGEKVISLREARTRHRVLVAAVRVRREGRVTFGVRPATSNPSITVDALVSLRLG